MKAFLYIILLFLSINKAFTQVTKLYVNSEKSSLMYEMSHPLHDWDATTDNYKAIITWDSEKQTTKAAAVSIPVKSFDSGNSNRDSHALETLEALKYPRVTFSSKTIIYRGGEDLTISGILNFHGVSKLVNIKARQLVTENTISISGNFKVDMTEYGVKPPSLMGLKTDKNITLTFMFSFQKPNE